VKNKKKNCSLDSFFEIKARGSKKRIEIFAGITTFLAMAYILTVNPNNILWGGTADPRFSSVFIATAIGAFIGTLLMALLAKMPLAQAPGMGLNAMVGTIIGGAMGFGYSYGNAMMLVFISGIIFLFLSFIPCGRNKKTGELISLREKIFDGMPKAVRTSISVGIGLFIAFIGLQNAHIVTDNQFTLLQLVDFNNPALWAKGGEACCATVALF
jgi:AGZA family xanthine/uracil permease-like MFS transporter